MSAPVDPAPQAVTQSYADVVTGADNEAARLGGTIRWRSRCGQAETDMGNAARFALDHQHTLRYVPGLDWHHWDGTRWARDRDGAAIRLAQETVRAIRDEARDLEEEAAERRFKHAIASEKLPRLEAMVKLARSDTRLVALTDEFDTDPWALNLPNGTLDLRTGELRPHDRDQLLTKLAPVDYDPDAQAPRWQQFLQTAVGTDPEVIDYLQRAAGYSLTGDTREQCLFIPEGPGANGKSTFVETLTTLLGDYSAHADASTFMVGRARAARSDVARLRGARLVAASEVEDDAQFAEVLVKQMTGGDKLVAAHLYHDEFEFRPQFKVWITANQPPQIRGTDHAIWRRMRVLPFHTKIATPDKALPQKLRAELPGILAWAVEGCRRWLADGLQPPAAIRAATQDYRAQQDTLNAFIDERCRLAPDAQCSPAAFRDAYTAWCTANRVSPRSDLTGALTDRLGPQQRSKHGRWWPGIEVQR